VGFKVKVARESKKRRTLRSTRLVWGPTLCNWDGGGESCGSSRSTLVKEPIIHPEGRVFSSYSAEKLPSKRRGFSNGMLSLSQKGELAEPVPGKPNSSVHTIARYCFT